jgi:predicted TIM-barrel fold metal-dependent hydrolase
MEQGAIDCHVHVFDPQRHSLHPQTGYLPTGQEIGTPGRLAAVLAAHGMAGALLVGPNSGYGEDNGCMLDTLAEGGGRYRGMAVVPLQTGRAVLAALQERGVVGVTLNAALLGTAHYREAGPLLHALADLDMVADVQVCGDQLVELGPLLERAGVRVLVDHLGRPDVGAGTGAPGFRELLRWGRSGRAVVKLSGHVKVSREPYPHPDLDPFVVALLDAFGPERCVWGSDWPFLRAPERMDYGPLLALLERHVPDSADRRRILVDTPRAVLGF